jgi:hypothetical protein
MDELNALMDENDIVILKKALSRRILFLILAITTGIFFVWLSRQTWVENHIDSNPSLTTILLFYGGIVFGILELTYMASKYFIDLKKGKKIVL